MKAGRSTPLLFSGSVIVVATVLLLSLASPALHADPRPARPPFPEHGVAANWRFNGADPAPLLAINVQTSESWSAYGLEMVGKEPRLLALPEISPAGAIHLSRAAGTLRWWYAPAWSSVSRAGSGPGEEARLLEIGAWSSQGAESWYSLVVEPDGSAIRFMPQGPGQEPILRAAITWLTGDFHQIALVWSSEQTLLFLDGERVAAGLSIALASPSSFKGTAGFCLGSDVLGGRLGQGQFEELYSFGRPCSEEDLAADFARNAPLAALGPVSAAEAKALELAIAETALLRELGLLDEPPPGPDYGCALWLEIGPESADSVRLILHNSEPGKTYQLMSSTDVSDPGNWVAEQTVVGHQGQNFTEATVGTEGRPILSFQVTEPGGLTVESSFAGMRNNDPNDFITFAGAVVDPPDTMGAVGPDHFVELLNGVVAVFSKSTGARIEAQWNTAFFGDSLADLFDPYIIYDFDCGRWVACISDRISGDVFLAVSRSSNPTGLLTEWRIYRLDVLDDGEEAFLPHMPSLGADENGLYLVFHLATETGSASKEKIIAISKSATGFPDNIPPAEIWRVATLVNTNRPASMLCPAVNFDPVPPAGVAWFLYKGAAQPPPTYQPGPIQYCRLQWNNGIPEMVDYPWTAGHTIPPPDPFFDLDLSDHICSHTPTLCAKSKDNTTGIVLRGDSRFQNAVVRNGYLWTCQQVGLNAQGSYAGELGGTLRSGCQWYKLQINNGTSLALAEHGRVYDERESNSFYYLMPSIAVNCAGDMVMGFSGSSATDYVGAYYIGRLANGPIPSAPALLKAGESAREGNLWGDYSATRVDPDGLTFWTVQEYAESRLPPPNEERDPWGTWIGKIRR